MPEVKQTDHNKCYLRRNAAPAKIFFVLSKVNKKIISVCSVKFVCEKSRKYASLLPPFLYLDFIISAYVSHKKDFGTD